MMGRACCNLQAWRKGGGCGRSWTGAVGEGPRLAGSSVFRVRRWLEVGVGRVKMRVLLGLKEVYFENI